MNHLTRYRMPLTTTPLRRELDRLFGELLPAFGSPDDDDAASAVWAPALDFTETEDAFVVKMDLPGIERDQVSVDVEDGTLTVRGERSEEEREEKENYLRMERRYGSFYRSVPLPPSATADDAKATFKNGVLTVRIPKTQTSKPRRIDVE